MIALQKEQFLGTQDMSTTEATGKLDRMFGRVFDRSMLIPFVVRTLSDTTTGSVTIALPDGRKNPDKDYYFQKVDATANTVTITAFGTQLINGSATYVLAAQYDRCLLIWNNPTQQWYIQ